MGRAVRWDSSASLPLGSDAERRPAKRAQTRVHNAPAEACLSGCKPRYTGLTANFISRAVFWLASTYWICFSGDGQVMALILTVSRIGNSRFRLRGMMQPASNSGAASSPPLICEFTRQRRQTLRGWRPGSDDSSPDSWWRHARRSTEPSAVVREIEGRPALDVKLSRCRRENYIGSDEPPLRGPP